MPAGTAAYDTPAKSQAGMKSYGGRRRPRKSLHKAMSKKHHPVRPMK